MISDAHSNLKKLERMSITSLRIAVVCDLKYATWKLYEWSVACACVLAETVLAIYESRSKNLLF